MSQDLTLAQLQLAYQDLSLAIAILSSEGQLLAANPAFIQVVPGAEHRVGQSLDGLLAPLASRQGVSALLQHSTPSPWHGELRLLASEGQSHTQVASIKRLELATGGEVAVLSLPNASATTMSNSNLVQLAFHDSLTGLANRALFYQLFEHEIQRAQRLDLRFAVLFIDLDKFKPINDNHGHDAGDALLSEVALRMRQSFRKSDVIARLGGDEFAILMTNINDPDTVAKVVDKMVRTIAKPFKAGSVMMQVSCSVGISIYPQNGQQPEELLQQADAAMYRAKHAGGNDYCFFSDALNQELQDIRLVEKHMEQGLAQQQFVPYFQPVIDQQAEKLVGIECLARWQHPTQGVKSAEEFIPVALKTGLLQAIFAQVLEQAFTHLHSWTKQLGLSVPLSINISSKQFFQAQTFDLIERLMASNEIAGDAIRIELTESTLQQSDSGVIEQLKRVQTAGLGLTLDDFGTGYSSLRYLQQLPVEQLKIDRSFVRNLENNPHDKVVVKAIIQLADTLDIQAVAEGVETQVQADFLAEHGCRIMQGYLFSPALDAASFGQYLQKQRRLSA